MHKSKPEQRFCEIIVPMSKTNFSRPDRKSVCKFLTNAKITNFYPVPLNVDLSTGTAVTIKLLIRDRKVK
jgi:hypothetical protein